MAAEVIDTTLEASELEAHSRIVCGNLGGRSQRSADSRLPTDCCVEMLKAL